MRYLSSLLPAKYKDLEEKNWAIWQAVDCAGIKRSGEFERAHYFEALLDLFDNLEEADVLEAVRDTIDRFVKRTSMKHGNIFEISIRNG